MNEANPKIIDAIKTIISELNMMGSGKGAEEAVDEALNIHRTLQQGFFRHVIVPAIRKFAKMHRDGYYDLRNQASCELANEILEAVERKPIPFI